MYVTRFAPTPSGPLHFGSLVTLTGAWLRCRSMKGRFLLRIEDLDLPRCPQGMSARILKEIALLGFDHDGQILYQSNNLIRYRQIIAKLAKEHEVFKCTCTRASLKLKRCNCQQNLIEASEITACNSGSLRFVPSFEKEKGFTDELLGYVPYHASLSFGEEYLILRRSDGIISYNLACVTDDIYSGVNEIVRGQDLLNATVPQLSLYKALEAPYPKYFHLPLALTTPDHKLSKQNHAKAVLSICSPEQALKAALLFLGQDTDFITQAMDCKTILRKASDRFDPAKIDTANRIASDFIA